MGEADESADVARYSALMWLKVRLRTKKLDIAILTTCEMVQSTRLRAAPALPGAACVAVNERLSRVPRGRLRKHAISCRGAA